MPFRRSPRARLTLGILIAAIVVAGIAVPLSLRTLEPRLRQWLVTTLTQSLESEIELGGVRLSWVPLRLHAKQLTVRHHGRRDVPPLIVVGSFVMDLRPADLWSSTIDRVWVDGLEVNIPPRDATTGKRPLPDPSGDDDGEDSDTDGLIIRRLTATNARLSVIPRREGKNPRVWDIYEVDLRNLRSGEPASFAAVLLNPIPYGKIEAHGHFGPWQSGEPGTSALSGEYTFAADLGTINGLAGQLNASGRMSGTIERIATTGKTETPDFKLTELDGIRLPLRTSYDATVDGTEGDVQLASVDVVLGKSTMRASGMVEGTKGIRGKRVVVSVKSQSADLGELLQFVSQAAQPPATGVMLIDATLDLPQGSTPVLDRLRLDGTVRAERVRFASDAVQAKIDELSRRGQGRPDDDAIEDVASRLATRFEVRKGVCTYRGLSFDVKGARIRLDGTHSFKSKAVDLAGVVTLTAPMSKTQTGFKSWLLKPFDPLFRKRGAGTRLVITVAGTQDQPKVGVDIGRTLRGR